MRGEPTTLPSHDLSIMPAPIIKPGSQCASRFHSAADASTIFLPFFGDEVNHQL
jgi:hypothetical protein